MDHEGFFKKFGCTPEEYSEKLNVKLRDVLERKAAQEDEAVLLAAVRALQHHLTKHFDPLVMEGIVKDWSLTIARNGECQIKVVSVKDLADMFRGRGYQVEVG